MKIVTPLSGDDSKAAASFTGSLTTTPLADVLRRIAVEERSGELHVAAPGFNKTVYFDRGFVVFASSDLTNDRLGESMIEAGRISRHEFALASMLMKSTKQKFGAVLVEAGIVPEEELGRYVAAQVNRIVLSLFLAKSGDYRFEEGPCTVPVELMVSLSVYRILMDGVRRMSRKALVLEGLPPLDTEVRIVDQPPFTLDFGKLRADEKAVLRTARDGATIRSIVETAGGHEGVTLRACYGLLCGGILEPVEADPRLRLLRVQEETGTFVLSEIRHKAGVSEETPVELAPAEAPPTPRVEPIATPAPRPEPTPAPQQRERPVTFQPAPSDGFTLSDLLDWFARAWSYVLGWFGASEPDTVVPPRAEIPRRQAPPVGTRPPTPPPEAVATGQPATPAAKESIGVPSWSLKDDPGTASEPSGSESVGVPSWSLKSDAPDEAAGSDATGTPSWSLKDAPEETAAPLKPTPPSPEPVIERLEAPDWSIQDSPGQPKPEPRQEEAVEPPAADAAEAVANETLAHIDDEFFIEGAILDDDESSMLSQIPHEEVTLGEGDLELGDEELEIGFELEDEDETTSAPPVTPELTTPAPAPAAPTAKGETPKKRPKPPKAERAAARPDKDYEIEPSDEDRVSEQGQQMRRMKQSGGESRLLRDVKLHFRMHDWQGAVPLLEQLVVISPGKALYRGMLARAISRDPVRRKDAEEHYVEALRLSPQDPELHYWLGLYYKSFGLSSRAIHEFRTTLRINPKHEGARKQLGGGKKDDSFGSVIKKLFG